MGGTADAIGSAFAVEVAYARPDEQVLVTVEVREGATVEEVIRRSKILDRFAEIDLTRQKVGIFGKLTGLDAPVRPRDRVEIYRALTADPKEVRKQRARTGRTGPEEG